MKKLILISGKAQHGKDTTANIIKRLLEKQNNKVVITHYAKYLKQIATDYYGWNGEKDEKGRKLLQELGTEIIREKMNMPEFHIKRICEDILIGESQVDYVIIPDVRFVNEITVPSTMFDVISIKVNRINFENDLNESSKQHSSENALNDYKFDIELYAENIEELEKEVLNKVLNKEM